MRRRLKSIAPGVFGVLVALALIFGVLVETLSRRTFDTPEPTLRASDDPALIERGRYLAFGPAHCAGCHGPPEHISDGTLDGTLPLSGGFAYPSPMGVLHFPNITPDETTGIGRYSDGQLARMLRHGVKPNGQAQLPIMEYQNISDEDVVALLSFMRAQKPVKNQVPEHELSFIGKAVKAFLVRPIGPQSAPGAQAPPERATVERGEYLANRVAQCAACHTRRDMTDFSYAGPRLAGGSELEEPWAPDVTFVPPNLTPDESTGHIVRWSEEQFVARFRAGASIKGSPMDWKMFARMSETDLKAIYRYLMTLEPVHNDTGPTVRPRAGG